MSLDEIPTRLPSRIAFLLGFAALRLAIALAIAWAFGVTLFFPKGYVAGFIYERADLIRAHVDFLMMAQFLLVFVILFKQYEITPPRWIILFCCRGAFFNPVGFLRRGLTPKIVPAPIVEPHFPLRAAVSFSLITIGFLVSVGLVAAAPWRARTSTRPAGAPATFDRA